MTKFFGLAGLCLLTTALTAPASSATLTPIAPYVDTGAIGTTLFGINNAGWTTGLVSYADGHSSGFVRTPDGTYSKFDNPAYPAGNFTSGRAISNDNTIIGFSYDTAGTNLTFRGFQRTADGTLTLLTRPGVGTNLVGIAQGINDSGAIVGNFRARATPTSPVRNHGYILDGANFVDLTDADHANASVNARGIDNSGTVVGWNSEGFNGARGWVYKGGNYEYFSHPGDLDEDGLGTTVFEAINNNGQVLGGYTVYDAVTGGYTSKAFSFDLTSHVFSDIEVPGATYVQTYGINDSGQYVLSTDAGQFIYSPDGPVAPDGSSVFMPVAGGDLPPGQAQFAITVVASVTYYIDPAYATGFEYLSGTGPLFASVIAPLGIGIDDTFKLYLWNGTDYIFDQSILAGVAFDFLTPVDRFELRGIPGSAGIDPNNPSGFVTGLKFAGDGQFNGFQNALTSVPEPATWSLMIVGFGLVGATLRRRVAVSA